MSSVAVAAPATGSSLIGNYLEAGRHSDWFRVVARSQQAAVIMTLVARAWSAGAQRGKTLNLMKVILCVVMKMLRMSR